MTGEYSTSEMLVNMNTATLEEFYPAVAIATLLRIIKDLSLSQHHTMVVQAITFIFKSLGIKCVPYIAQVGCDIKCVPYIAQVGCDIKCVPYIAQVGCDIKCVPYIAQVGCDTAVFTSHF